MLGDYFKNSFFCLFLLNFVILEKLQQFVPNYYPNKIPLSILNQSRVITPAMKRELLKYYALVMFRRLQTPPRPHPPEPFVEVLSTSRHSPA